MLEPAITPEAAPSVVIGATMALETVGGSGAYGDPDEPDLDEPDPDEPGAEGTGVIVGGSSAAIWPDICAPGIPRRIPSSAAMTGSIDAGRELGAFASICSTRISNAGGTAASDDGRGGSLNMCAARISPRPVPTNGGRPHSISNVMQPSA